MALIKGGYILQPRQIDYGSSVSTMPPVTREVWSYILRNVNHEDDKFFKRGTGLFTYQQMINDLSWYVGYRKKSYTKTQIYKALRRLREDHATTTMKTTRGIIITVCNYVYYQTPENYEDETKTLRRRCEGGHYTQEEEEEEERKERKEAGFEDFWKEYCSKTGAKKEGKEAARQRWIKMSAKMRKSALDVIPIYANTDVVKKGFPVLAKNYLLKTYQDFSHDLEERKISAAEAELWGVKIEDLARYRSQWEMPGVKEKYTFDGYLEKCYNLKKKTTTLF